MLDGPALLMIGENADSGCSMTWLCCQVATARSLAPNDIISATWQHLYPGFGFISEVGPPFLLMSVVPFYWKYLYSWHLMMV